MADFREPIRQALAALESERNQIEEDIRALRRILSRPSHAESPRPAEPAGAEASNPPRKGQPGRGDAEREILGLLAGSAKMTAAEISSIRGTSRNAASNVLRRLAVKGQVVHDSRAGTFSLPAAEADDAQGSLPVSTGSESDAPTEED